MSVRNTLVCLYLPHIACWLADVCWHRSVGSAWGGEVPTHPYEGHTAAGYYGGANQRPFPPPQEPVHLHKHKEPQLFYKGVINFSIIYAILYAIIEYVHCR